MYVIVVGGGKVGYYLTKTLLSEGYEVLLVERDPRKAQEIEEHLNTVVLAGDGAEASILKNAGAGRADVVIAVTGEDEDNLVICQIAKQRFQVGKTIARVNNPKNEALFKTLGIDVTVSQTNHILHLIERSIPESSFVHLINLQHPDLAIVDAKVSEGSFCAHKTIGELEMPVNCIIAAISRGAQVLVPSPTTELLPGDDVIAIAHRDQEDELRQLLVHG